MTFKSLDLVLPCYNPIPGWEDTIIQSYKILKDRIQGTDISFYIVNDGSSRAIGDVQLAKLKSAIPSFHYLAYPVNKGKGYALRYGVKETRNEICIYTDIDFPFTEESLLSVYFSLCKEEADIVVGNRDKAYYEKVPRVRIIISKILRFFIRFFLGMKISDTQCGLKGFNEKGKQLFLRTTIDRYLFDLEFVHLASNTKNIRIIPMPVKLKDGVVFSRMNMKVLMTEASGFIKILLKHYLGR